MSHKLFTMLYNDTKMFSVQIYFLFFFVFPCNSNDVLSSLRGDYQILYLTTCIFLKTIYKEEKQFTKLLMLWKGKVEENKKYIFFKFIFIKNFCEVTFSFYRLQYLYISRKLYYWKLFWIIILSSFLFIFLMNR